MSMPHVGDRITIELVPGLDLEITVDEVTIIGQRWGWAITRATIHKTHIKAHNVGFPDKLPNGWKWDREI